jgi:7-carboxy-7-deazaguanine synthase
MTYSVKEIFYTLQGEGANAGRPAVFCRFAGCNLWSGREIHRQRAVCQFCDTDFVGTNGAKGGKYKTAEMLASSIDAVWRGSEEGFKFLVFTGGEPLLQLDDSLVRAAKALGFAVAVETNGTLPAPRSIDWICVSPKAGTRLVVDSGEELKLVFPQSGIHPEDFESLQFQHFFLQPMDGPFRRENERRAVEYCLAQPRWRLSIQSHKVLNIP